jgi:hypothetical protein
VIRPRKILLLLALLVLIPVVALAGGRGGGGGGSGGGGGGGGGGKNKDFTKAKGGGYALDRIPPEKAPPESVIPAAAPDGATTEPAAATEAPAIAPDEAASELPIVEEAPSPPPAPVAKTAPASATPTPTGTTWQSYRVLSDRNIFMRNRGRQTRDRAPRPTPPPENPDERIVLTGIIQQGADYVAFFEDSRSRKTTTLQAGAAVGRGKLASIALDAVKYAYNGTTTTVTIGDNLTGRATALTPVPSPSAVPSTTPTPTMGGTFPAPSMGRPLAATTPGGAAPASGNEAMADMPLAPAAILIISTDQPPTAPPSAAAGSPDSSGGPASLMEQMRQRAARERGNN